MRAIALVSLAVLAVSFAAGMNPLEAERPAYMTLLDDTEQCTGTLANGSVVSTATIPFFKQTFNDNQVQNRLDLSACEMLPQFEVNGKNCTTPGYAVIFDPKSPSQILGSTCDNAIFFTRSNPVQVDQNSFEVTSMYNTSIDAPLQRVLKVTFTCDEAAVEEPVLNSEVVIETNDSEEAVLWVFRFSTVHVCPTEPSSGGGDDKKLSTGAIVGITAGGVAVVGGGVLAAVKFRGGSSAPAEGEYSRV